MEAGEAGEVKAQARELEPGEEDEAGRHIVFFFSSSSSFSCSCFFFASSISSSCFRKSYANIFCLASEHDLDFIFLQRGGRGEGGAQPEEVEAEHDFDCVHVTREDTINVKADASNYMLCVAFGVNLLHPIFLKRHRPIYHARLRLAVMIHTAFPNSYLYRLMLRIKACIASK